MKKTNENIYNKEKKIDFTAYNIQNVWEQKPVEDLFTIHFSIDEFDYRLIVFIRNERYEPGNIIHGHQTFERSCPICGSRYNICDTLIPNKEAFFYYLIGRPGIRLRWVTRAPALFSQIDERKEEWHGLKRL